MGFFSTANGHVESEQSLVSTVPWSVRTAGVCERILAFSQLCGSSSTFQWFSHNFCIIQSEIATSDWALFHSLSNLQCILTGVGSDCGVIFAIQQLYTHLCAEFSSLAQRVELVVRFCGICCWMLLHSQQPQWIGHLSWSKTFERFANKSENKK